MSCGGSSYESSYGSYGGCGGGSYTPSHGGCGGSGYSSGCGGGYSPSYGGCGGGYSSGCGYYYKRKVGLDGERVKYKRGPSLIDIVNDEREQDF